MLALLEKNGLDRLVEEIAFGGAARVATGWSNWFEAAVLQLEEDDRFGAHFTDALAGSLEELDAAMNDGLAVDQAARALLSLYYRGEQAQNVEIRWRRRMAGLGRVQLETGLWLDLVAALDAAVAGHAAQVSLWLDQMQSMFANSWASYRDSDILVSEVTEESQVGHRLLGEGILAWTEAFARFRQGLAAELDRTAVMQKAEEGQRLLVGLQVIESESKDCADHFLAAWAN